MNDTIQDAINGLAGQLSVLDDLMKLAANDIVYLAAPLLLLLWFWPAANGGRALNQRLAAATALGVVMGLGTAALLGQFHSVTRPFVSEASTRLLISHAADNSFPSEHATLAFAVGGVIVWRRRMVGAMVLAAATLVAFSRVYVGLHWPGDVAAGALIGLVASGFAARTVPWWAKPQSWASKFFPDLLLAKT